MDHTNKVVVITGAAKGIGKITAQLFASQGAKVSFCDIDKQAGLDTLSELKSAGYQAFFQQVDITNMADMQSFADATAQEFGGIDILVCNAGAAIKGTFTEISLEDWNKCININLTGTFIACKAVVPHMLKRGHGEIVIISSASALTGTGAGAAYASSKAGVNGFTRALARDLTPKGIIVNAIAPRTIITPLMKDLFTKEELDEKTRQIPLGRIGEPEDIAHWISWLATEESDFMCGEIVMIDGGRTYLS